ncbi:MAG TPA: hypothetical protein VMS76_19420 [Planctomycetota bacterium]|nr:hypothetical protein [Planctomycetota bacterium]
MKPRVHALPVLLVLVPLGATWATAAQAPWRPSGDPWRTDPAWHDGKAEVCVYEATRTIYGVPRSYLATAYTDKEHVDPRTTNKSEAEGGLEVFKHHWSERVPTENYDYDFSTMTYTLADSLEAYKLTVGTQEDCGASFKAAWRDGTRLRWQEFNYFPGEFLSSGEMRNAAGIHFADELTLLCRDFPFGAPEPRELLLVPGQRSNRQVPFEPLRARVRYAGRETLELPYGTVDAHRLSIVPGRGQPSVGLPEIELWFAADASAPLLHALVQYEDSHGTHYRLRSIERRAYWER